MSGSLSDIDVKTQRDHFRPRGWEGMPGVVYPHEEKKHKVAVKSPQSVDRSKVFTSQEVAQMMRVSEAAARIYLHKKKCKHVLVRGNGVSTSCWWNKAEVMKLVKARLPIAEGDPCSAGKFVSSKEAAEIIGAGRSSLYRYAKRKWLHPIPMRVMTEAGLRNRIFYRRDEVMKFRFRLHAMHEKLSEMMKAQADIAREMQQEGGFDEV